MQENITAENIKTKDRKFPSNKKKTVFITIAVILLTAVIAIAGILIFGMLKNNFDDTDICGAWELIENPELTASTDNEAEDKENAYYVFDAPDKYGRGDYYTCYQGGIEYFEYELMEEDSVKKINLGTEDMEYRITGSKLLGNAKLIIIFPEYTDEITGEKHEASEYVFKQAKNPSYENQGYEDYTVNKALLGTWTNNEKTLSYFHYTYSYEQSVEVKDNGIMIIHYKSDDLALDRYMYYAYTAKDSELTFSLVTDKDIEYTVSYGFDDSGNLKFSGDTTADSIFADAFFGEVTFYTAENLPKTATQSAD